MNFDLTLSLYNVQYVVNIHINKRDVENYIDFVLKGSLSDISSY